MPTGAVKGKRQERLWNKAKLMARRKALGIKDKWAYIMGTFQRMKHRTGGKK